MATIGGMATFKIDGRSYSTKGEFEIKIKNVSYEAVPAADGTIHNKQTVVADVISGKLLATPDLNPAMIPLLNGSTIKVETKKGGTNSIALLKNAFFTGDASFTTLDGEFNIEFTGQGSWI
jgi:hypothetical protein